MERQLPEHVIEGTSFVVEVEHFGIRQKDRPSNTISFEQLIDKGGYYELPYNMRTKNIAGLMDELYDDVRQVKVPPMASLDPVGMAAKFGSEEKDLTGKTDMEVMITDNKDLLERLGGKMPILEVDGKDFTIDVLAGELRSVGDPDMTIPLESLFPENDSPYSSMFYYDTKTCRASEKSIDQAPAPPGEHVVILIVPRPIDLDPVGVAKCLGEDPISFQKLIPAKLRHKAEMMPVKNINLKTGQAPQKYDAEHATNKKKRSKGNHL